MNLDHADWDLVPNHMRDGLRLYIERGIPPGGFMTAVLSNDLFVALAKADEINRRRIHEIVQFIYMDAPSMCWGSPEAVKAWVDRGGLHGWEREERGEHHG